MNTHTQSLSRQQGFTLIEIMIALTMGLVLMIGVSQLFLSNREGFRVQNGMAHLQENARFAIDQFRRDVGLAGFGLQGFGVTAASLDGAGTASDTLVIQYQSATDCLGQPAPGGIAVNTYTIGDSDNDLIFGLDCQGNGGAAVQAVVDGIDNMQILYGIDTDATLDGFANRYVPAGPGVDWQTVVSVRVAFLVNSVDPVTNADDQKDYTLLNAPTIGPLLGLVRRQILTTTIPLRNARRLPT